MGEIVKSTYEEKIDASIAKIIKEEAKMQLTIHEFHRFVGLEMISNGLVSANFGGKYGALITEGNMRIKAVFQQRLGYSERTIERCVELGSVPEDSWEEKKTKIEAYYGLKSSKHKQLADPELVDPELVPLRIEECYRINEEKFKEICEKYGGYALNPTRRIMYIGKVPSNRLTDAQKELDSV